MTRDGRWLEAARWGPDRNAIFFAKREENPRRWVRVTPEGPFHSGGEVVGDIDFVHTTEGAPHGRLFRVDLAHPARSEWREIVPERTDAILESVDVIGDRLLLEYRMDAETHHELRRFDGSLDKEIERPQIGAVGSVGVQLDKDEAIGWFATYTDPYAPFWLRPPTYAMQPFPFAQKPRASEHYVTEKVFYTSPDGTRAPIFLVHAKGLDRSKPAPLLLYGYGAFGYDATPQYRAWIRPWLDRGGVYAEPVLRGGGEYGEAWHVAGKRAKRANTYADFLAAAEYLVHEGWTDPSRLLIRGASAGGLLVAVAMTERPDLFAGVICEVPLTDMVRFPLGSGYGTLWRDEYGSPDDAGDFPTLLRYSPYHRIKEGVRYPPLLLVSGAEDTRVDPMHARKLAARLEAVNPGGKVLLRMRVGEGHGGATRTTGEAEDEAEVLTFALSVVTPAP